MSMGWTTDYVYGFASTDPQDIALAITEDSLDDVDAQTFPQLPAQLAALDALRHQIQAATSVLIRGCAAGDSCEGEFDGMALGVVVPSKIFGNPPAFLALQAQLAPYLDAIRAILRAPEDSVPALHTIQSFG